MIFSYILQVIFSWEKEKNVDENCCSTTRVCSKWVNSSHCNDLPFFQPSPGSKPDPRIPHTQKNRQTYQCMYHKIFGSSFPLPIFKCFLAQQINTKRKTSEGSCCRRLGHTLAVAVRPQEGRSPKLADFLRNFSQIGVSTVTAGVNWGPFHQLVEFHEIGGFPLSIWGEVVVVPMKWKHQTPFFESGVSLHNIPILQRSANPFPSKKMGTTNRKKTKRGNLLSSSLCLLNSKNSQSQARVVRWDTRTLQRHAGQSANLSRLAKELLASTISSCCNAKGSSVAKSMPQMKVT